MAQAKCRQKSVAEAAADVMCLICRNNFKKPKTLPCGHSFCKKCIVNLANSISKPKCPTCKKEFIEPGNLSTNWSLSNLSQTFESLTTEENKQQGNQIQIFVRDMNDKSMVLEVQKDDTVDVLMDMIYKRNGIPKAEQHLIYAGKSLREGKRLKEYNVQKDSTIHLVMRLRGGGCFN